MLLGRRELNIYSHLNLVLSPLHVTPTRLFYQISCVSIPFVSCISNSVFSFCLQTHISKCLLNNYTCISHRHCPQLQFTSSQPPPSYKWQFFNGSGHKLEIILDSSLCFCLLHSVTKSCSFYLQNHSELTDCFTPQLLHTSPVPCHLYPKLLHNPLTGFPAFIPAHL